MRVHAYSQCHVCFYSHVKFRGSPQLQTKFSQSTVICFACPIFNLVGRSFNRVEVGGFMVDEGGEDWFLKLAGLSLRSV